jgi:hypothetical protein
MISSLFGLAPSLPASELPVPSHCSSMFPPEGALRYNQKELDHLDRLLSERISLWPNSEEPRDD